MNHWVMDMETLKNCTTLCAEHFKTSERREFVIHKSRNDIVALIDFLIACVENGEWHVSFNGLGFDAQITEHILRHAKALVDGDPEFIANFIYEKAQDIILRQDQGEWQEYSEKEIQIRQVDVYKLNHWDNHAKRSSLKWIQYSMDWHNMQEMPIHHSTYVNTEDQIHMILTYCWNDVTSTKKIMQLSSGLISLRRSLTAEYGINLYSASEPKISKELFLLFLSQRTGIKKWDLKQLRTNRTQILVKDIILPYVKFQTKPFKDLLEAFQDLTIYPNITKKGFKHVVDYKQVKTVYGLGGLHGATKPGVYKTGDGMIVVTSDVKSFYPNLAIKNQWSPAHLPKAAFCDLYEWFYDERVKIPKKDPRNYVYKIILNATYGLANEPNSFLYDPEFAMRITINGQLLLSMLYEMLAEGIPGSIPLMQNTDGVEMMIPAHYKQKYLDICAEWEKLTSLELEHDEYQKMLIWDVNNYIAVHKFREVSEEEFGKMKKEFPHDLYKQSGGKFYYGATKSKGRFEWDPLAKYEAKVLHKNKSFLIVPKAIFHYFIHDTPPEKFMSQNRDIMDYCAGVKAKGDWGFQRVCSANGEVTTENLSKVIRYYMTDSEGGCKIIKRNKSDNRKQQLEAGKWMQMLFSQYEEKSWHEYQVNEKFYLDLIYKEISAVQPLPTNQTSLFDN